MQISIAASEETFWANMQREGDDECWLWLYQVGPQKGRPYPSYGIVKFRGRATPTHRVAFEFHNGNIDPTLEVLHSCDNPSCCNPRHLSQGTHADNMHDMARKGRATGMPIGERHYLAKLNEENVRYIRQAVADGLKTRKALAREFGVTPTAICLVANRIQWKHVS